MDADTVILGAFSLFVVLLVFRGKLHVMRQERENAGIGSRYRFLFALVRIIVLGGLMLYMIPVLWKEVAVWKESGTVEVFLRCLVFVFTIYIFISDTRSLLRWKNGGDPENKA